MVLAVVLVVVAAGLGLGLGLSSSGSSERTQATTLYHQSLAAVKRAGSFHYVAISVSGSTEMTTVGDAGADQGTQQITIGSESFTLVLLSGIVYFNGNAGAIEDQLGLSSATATTEAGKWIAVHDGDGPYNALEAGITVSSALTQVTLVPKQVAPVKTANGVAVSRITGSLPASGGQSVPGSARLDVVGATHLPATYEQTVTGGANPGSYDITFSRYREPVQETAPAGSVPFATLSPGGASSGSGPVVA